MGLHQVTAFGAPFMDFLKLDSDQPTVAIFGQSPTNSGLPTPNGIPSYAHVCGIMLRVETMRPVDAFSNHGEIVKVEGWMGTGNQVTSPGGDTRVRLVGTVVTVDTSAKISQRFSVSRGRTAKDQIHHRGHVNFFLS